MLPQVGKDLQRIVMDAYLVGTCIQDNPRLSEVSGGSHSSQSNLAVIDLGRILNPTTYGGPEYRTQTITKASLQGLTALARILGDAFVMAPAFYAAGMGAGTACGIT